MREDMHQKRFARWNQSSRWKSLLAGRRTRSVDQHRAGGIRRASCDNQRKEKRSRRLRAASSRRDSEILTVSLTPQFRRRHGELSVSISQSMAAIAGEEEWTVEIDPLRSAG